MYVTFFSDCDLRHRLSRVFHRSQPTLDPLVVSELPAIAYAMYRALRTTGCRCPKGGQCSRCVALASYEMAYPHLKFTERPHHATAETYIPAPDVTG